MRGVVVMPGRSALASGVALISRSGQQALHGSRSARQPGDGQDRRPAMNLAITSNLTGLQQVNRPPGRYRCILGFRRSRGSNATQPPNELPAIWLV